MKTRIAMISPLVFTALTASADPLTQDSPPRGPEILSIAGACGAGPIGQIGKAGIYNVLCSTLTEAEKCLALIKTQFGPNNNLSQVQGDTKKIMAEFCLEQFKNELLGQ